MKVGNNTRSWIPPTGHQKISGGVEGVFLYGDKRIKRSVTGDRNEISEIREGIITF